MKKRKPNHFTTKNTHLKKKTEPQMEKGDAEIGIMAILETDEYQTPFRMTIDKSVFLSIPSGFSMDEIKLDIGQLYRNLATYDTSVQMVGGFTKDQLNSQLSIALTYYARSLYELWIDTIKKTTKLQTSMGITFSLKVEMLSVLEYKVVENMDPIFNDFESWKTHTQEIVNDIENQ